MQDSFGCRTGGVWTGVMQDRRDAEQERNRSVEMAERWNA